MMEQSRLAIVMLESRTFFRMRPMPGQWLKPGAWGYQTEERSYPKRRGFRPAE